jgi:hypothetical protein
MARVVANSSFKRELTVSYLLNRRMIAFTLLRSHAAQVAQKLGRVEDHPLPFGNQVSVI